MCKRVSVRLHGGPLWSVRSQGGIQTYIALFDEERLEQVALVGSP